MKLFSPPSTDIWRCGVLAQPVQSIVTDGVNRERATLLPDAGAFRFQADPFGMVADGQRYIFVEGYDYRTKHGVIDCILPDGTSETVLRLRHHLSYPFVFECDGAFYMLPECHKSGALTLYRADAFPRGWRSYATLLDFGAIDASITQHNGLWWLLYTRKDGDAGELKRLHIAYADAVAGPYTQHPQNPVLTDITGARPAGTPFVADNMLHLPVQDCSATYGGAIGIVRFETLTRDAATTTRVRTITPADFGFADYMDGCHTLSAVGDVTVFDVKKIDRSWSRVFINLQRRIRRLFKAR